jgi:hypothetical protein
MHFQGERGTRPGFRQLQMLFIRRVTCPPLQTNFFKKIKKPPHRSPRCALPRHRRWRLAGCGTRAPPEAALCHRRPRPTAHRALSCKTRPAGCTRPRRPGPPHIEPPPKAACYRGGRTPQDAHRRGGRSPQAVHRRGGWVHRMPCPAGGLALPRRPRPAGRHAPPWRPRAAAEDAPRRTPRAAAEAAPYSSLWTLGPPGRGEGER